jgi:hypothetical protein
VEPERKPELLRLLVWLLLLLLLAHLHLLLEHLLWRAAVWKAWRHVPERRMVLRLGSWILNLRLLRLIVVSIRVGLGICRLTGLDGSATLEGEDKLAGSSLPSITNHEDVVASAIQELVDDFASRSWAVVAEDALIVAEALNLDSGCGGDFMHDLLEAGICGDYGEIAAAEMNFGGICLGKRRPIWRGDFSGFFFHNGSWYGRGRSGLDSPVGCV